MGNKIRYMKRYNFKFIDLFAGIGGFHQAMTLYGGECVFTSEIDIECKKQYEKQFRAKVHGDINLCLNDIPEFDVLCAGFPCQTFSKAGNQEGFNDKMKGQLFFRIIDILKKHKECKFIVLENVRNLADNKEFWNTIQQELKALDFFITQDPIIKSPADFGIPQNRERVYILGIKKSLINTNKLKNGWIHTEDLKLQEFEKKCVEGTAFSILDLNNKENKKYIITNEEKLVLKAWEEFKREIIPSKQIGAPIWLDYFGLGIEGRDNDLFKEKTGYYKQLVKAKKKHRDNPSLACQILQDGTILEDTPDWKKRFIDRNRELYLDNKNKIDNWYSKYCSILNKKVFRKFEWNCGPNYTPFKNCIIQFRQSGVRVKKSDTFPSLVAIVNTPVIWDKILNDYRKITVREAANLQSFRANYNFICENNVSYKQLGNAVNVKVIKIITRQLFDLAIDGWDKTNKG